MPQPGSGIESIRTAMEDNYPDDFVDGSIDDVVIRSLERYRDARGWLMELFRHDEMPYSQWPAMAYVSETLPGVMRGPHEHVSQTDYFAFIGPGEFALYLWDLRKALWSFGKRMKILAGENNAKAIMVPPGIVHAYKNIGQSPGWVFNAPNCLYAGDGKRQPVDEIRHEERSCNLFVVD